MDLGLNGKVILITGGASGIGAAITRACLEEGARVIVAGRLSGAAAAFVQQIEAAKASCDFFEAELADPGRCEAAIQFVQHRHGRLDGLVNNAGVNDGVSLEQGTPEKFMESLRQNLLHYYALAHFALPMLRDSRGCIVNISSKVALTGQGGTSAYAAAKGAQLALTREWAAELLAYGVRSNAVIPAEVWTPLYEQWVSKQANPDEFLERIRSRIPLEHRMTEPREIAATVVFLLSDRVAGHITGQQLVVDGGYVHLDRALT